MLFNNSEISLVRFEPTSITTHKEELLNGEIDAQELAKAQREDLKMQIAAALSQKRIYLNAQTKERIATIYQSFSAKMFERIKDAVQMYSRGLKEADNAPNELSKQKLIDYADQKFKKDCDLIQDLVDHFLLDVYSDLR
ncbi:MAG: hypothetical protein IM473_01700 [Microcystis sp. M015S2]|jgi:hypothetical protein|uniref:Uncharacterized protein n=3 Tax=Microcystis TaxID=1125 RepID=A0A2Z6UQP6_MICAE|nr:MULTISPECIES: hypothetical protein [Microcystis]MCA2552258.1 hypothetical protein [Microcystis sp. M04BS1]TRT88559.1 MAG: hypothetical protein EWV82_02630 [Microcystis aeruginosa Ma_AC_P_19900807_S299]TRU23585.1 MAG: hypothetical protein EWV81_15775 [Microcystis aeruginosa Ma_SC_T_19800800_S464]TRV44915.1 MAG: hypothetical protein EWV43_17840 [Microcystis panniformis Mp_MB_F_20080800_S26D]TRV48763.1 MAG: hypothetical protein EWV87_11650 [Microcystis panniformis Mp_GB_SS_20050300_S99]TRV556